MNVRSVYTLKRRPTLDAALAHVKKIQRGVGKHSEAKLEIQYDPKYREDQPQLGGDSILVSVPEEGEAKESPNKGPWSVVVVNETPVPGGKTCAECEGTHFEDDYLCTDCRAAMG